MIFPREHITVGDCIAVACIRTRKDSPYQIGDPLMRDYTFTLYEEEKWISHRLSYNLNVKPIPKDVGVPSKEGLILHTCDNKWCINPEHLYLGDQSDNMMDLSNRNPEWKKKISKQTLSRWDDDLRRKIISSNKKRAGEKRPAQSKSMKESWSKRKARK